MVRDKTGKRADKGPSARNSGKNAAPIFDKDKRIYLMVLAFIAAFVFIGIGRVTYIKLAHGREYESKLISQLVNGGKDKSIMPARGAVLDCNQQPLALSSTVYNVIWDIRMMVEEHDKKTGEKASDDERKAAEEKWNKTFETLNQVLGIPMEELTAHVQIGADGKPKTDKSYFKLAKKVSFEKGQQIMALKYPWLYCEEENQRVYPQGELAAQVVGFISGENGEGSYGLESRYNTEMTGIEGREFRAMNDNSNVVTKNAAAVGGNTLITTIDSTLQQYANEACKTAYTAYEPENTACIIMNPKTGAILAMAQYPTFDPNSPRKFSDEVEAGLKKTWERYDEKRKKQLAVKYDDWKLFKVWKNFSITETFEPGSTYKPIVAAMALEAGVISPNETFNCPGVKTVADYEVHCHNVDGHGTITLEEALADSCNVAMMEIITKLGAETYYKMHRDFGFGEKT
ncbi:MAG: hypothetical protein IJR59_04875, partial [Firmicutes bacterium]|nr:hypothetical protein [Bacillota bacterium]